MKEGVVLILKLGSIYDMNSLKLKIRAKQESQLPIVREGSIMLVMGGEKRISKQMDIYINIELGKKQLASIQILGQIDQDNYRLVKREHAYSRVLISDIPSKAIARNVLKLLVMVVDIQYLRINLKCSRCNRFCTSADRPECEPQCHEQCPEPVLSLVVLAVI